MIALTTSRMLTSRRRPPGFAGGMSGSTIAHCSSVRSVAYAIRVGCMCTLPCTRKGASCSKLGIQGKPAFRIASQRGPLGYHPCRALGNAAELHCPLGDVVHVVLYFLVDPVEQLVQGDEVRPLDVPVGVLGLRLQVDAVGQASDEQFDSLDAGGLGEAVLRLEHGGLQVEGISS